MPRQQHDSASLIRAEQWGTRASARPAAQVMVQDAKKKKTKAQAAAGSEHGASIKNPATYEALKREGKSKSSAAAISNAALNKGWRKGVHRGK